MRKRNMKSLLEGLGIWEAAEESAIAQNPTRGTEPAKVKASSLPEKKTSPGVIGEAVAMGWGAESGEVDVVAAMVREQFPEPPIDGRAFPHFPTFCAGYGKGCGACRFFRMGRGPFCAVWGAAWPKFQRDAETDTATW